MDPIGRVLITGGTKGIGLGVARAFLQNGDGVVLLYRRDLEAADRVIASLRAGTRPVAVECDVVGAKAPRDTINRAWEVGPLRCLMNNASLMNRTEVLDITLKDWQQVMDTNLRGYFVAAQAFARLAMRDEREGSSSTSRRLYRCRRCPTSWSIKSPRRSGIGAMRDADDPTRRTLAHIAKRRNTLERPRPILRIERMSQITCPPSAPEGRVS